MVSKHFNALLQAVGSAVHHGEQDGPWIRVGLDTGGIAAGAENLMAILRETSRASGITVPVLRSGSYGFAYMDPLVEVKTSNALSTLYGSVDVEVARRIITEHILAGRLIDDHIVASRLRGDTINCPTTAILVCDTSRECGDRTVEIQDAFRELLAVVELSDVQVVRALDMGLYQEGIVVQLLPSGVTYSNVLLRDIPRIVQSSIAKNTVLDDLIWTKPDPQVRIVLRNCGLLDPESIEDALLHGAYAGLASILGTGEPVRVIDTLKNSGLRGRGGAGFPTGAKWELTRAVRSDQRYVICNADEGDPGAFMDRSILEGDPHSVLEGLAIAAYAIGATKGFLYIRAEYPLAVQRMELALAAARAHGLLGSDILGSGWSFDAEIRLGAGAFVCGEETALIASIEGRRGSPEPRPPYPSVKGLWGKPTCINNVETLAAVPWIIINGAGAYTRHGMGPSAGTKVFAVTGKVRNPQLVEVPMGTTVREIVYGICGGVHDDLEIKGVQTGGPSGGIIPSHLLDTPISYESLQKLGSIMGSGGMLVMDEHDCMVDVAAFYLRFCVDESCGKCAPCRVGGFQMLQLIQKILRGRGALDDIDQIRRICHAMQHASLCGLGQTAPNPVLSTLRYFEEEYMAYIEGGASYARKRKKALAEGKPVAIAS